MSGTATAGTDYTALGGSVTFAANSGHTDVTVSVTDDGGAEPTETVTVTLDPDDDFELGNDSDTVFIKDNDTRRVYWVSTSSADRSGGSNWSTNVEPAFGLDVGAACALVALVANAGVVLFSRRGWPGSSR